MLNYDVLHLKQYFVNYISKKEKTGCGIWTLEVSNISALTSTLALE